jgi:hypothetical protein
MDDTFMLYFPSKLSKNKVPEREYFFNVLNTFQNDYITQLIKHAHEQRNSSQAESREQQTIEITDDWWKALNAVPFISRKYFTIIHSIYVKICNITIFCCIFRAQGQNRASSQSKLKTSATGAQKTAS